MLKHLTEGIDQGVYEWFQEVTTPQNLSSKLGLVFVFNILLLEDPRADNSDVSVVLLTEEDRDLFRQLNGAYHIDYIGPQNAYIVSFDGVPKFVCIERGSKYPFENVLILNSGNLLKVQGKINEQLAQPH